MLEMNNSKISMVPITTEVIPKKEGENGIDGVKVRLAAWRSVLNHIRMHIYTVPAAQRSALSYFTYFKKISARKTKGRSQKCVLDSQLIITKV